MKKFFALLIFISSSHVLASDCRDLVSSRLDALAKEFVHIQMGVSSGHPRFNGAYISKELALIQEKDPSARARFEKNVAETMRNIKSAETNPLKKRRDVVSKSLVWTPKAEIETFLQYDGSLLDFKISSEDRNKMGVVSELDPGEIQVQILDIGKKSPLMNRIFENATRSELSPSLKYLVVYPTDFDFKIFDLASNKEVFSIDGSSGSKAKRILFNDDESKFVLEREGAFLQYDISLGPQQTPAKLQKKSWPEAIAFTSDGKGLFFQTENAVHVWNFDSQNSEMFFKFTESSISETRISQDGSNLFVALQNEVVKIDVKTGSQLLHFSVSEEKVSGLSLGSIPKYIFVHAAQKLHVFDSETGAWLGETQTQSSHHLSQSGEKDEFIYGWDHEKKVIHRWKAKSSADKLLHVHESSN